MSPRPFSKRTPRSTASGFTAIELMVVVAIVVILAALAMPSFRETIQHYRVKRVAEDLTATIYFARSEAIRRGGHVTIRKAPATTGCEAATTQEWSCGWNVFFDVNESGTLNATDGDVLLQAPQVPKGVTVMLFQGSSSGPASMKADRWGRFSGLGAFSFALQPTDSKNIDLTMEVCMASGGRLHVLKGTDTCH